MFNSNPGHFHNQGRLNCGIGLASTIGGEIKKRGLNKVLVVTEELLVNTWCSFSSRPTPPLT